MAAIAVVVVNEAVGVGSSSPVVLAGEEEEQIATTTVNAMPDIAFF